MEIRSIEFIAERSCTCFICTRTTRHSDEETFQNAVAFLDETVPNWDERIDLERLDISSPYNCVFGQLFEDKIDGDEIFNGYDYAREQWGMAPESESWIGAFAFSHFQPAWEALVRARRALKAADAPAKSDHALTA